MASYTELRQLFGDSDLKNRLDVACIVAAEGVRTEAPETANHEHRLRWAKAVFSSPRAQSEKMLMALLAANKELTVAQIQAATDTALQAKVDAAVDVFADGS